MASCLTRLQQQQYLFQAGLGAIPLLGSVLGAYTPYSSPLFCPFKALTGIPCPSCGLTRSFTALALGDLPSALSYHLFGPFLWLTCGLLLVQSLWSLFSQKPLVFRWVPWHWPATVQLGGAFTVLIYHLLRLRPLLISGELGQQFSQSPLGSLF
ncbi:DUF2752 domain-containing protein [Synechocystis sp. LKSZ1]|uniref:DUF2752 domain-containing protein n=1 Tax=Synechocystis sp. LKSZ1 TaxID=3144951 RepID=UPI00336C0A9E